MTLTVPPWPLIRTKCLSLLKNFLSHRSIFLMILTTGFPVVLLILLRLRTLFLKLLTLLAIPRLVSHLKLLLQGSSMLISRLSTHSARALPFLISVVTFLIHSHLMSDMRKSFKTCSLFAIGILIKIKIELEFSILFSLSRYIFSLFFLYLLFLFIYIYICYNNFLLYVTHEFPIFVSHIILITSKYSIISQKIHPSLIILSPYVSIRFDFSSPLLWKKGVFTISLDHSSLSLEASCFL